MAYFRLMPDNKVRAEVVKLGVRRSKMHKSMAAARAWAAREETIIEDASKGDVVEVTLLEAIARYEREVSPKKRGHAKERLRFSAFIRDFPRLCAKKFGAITSADIADWRDKRLQKVSPSSLVREATQLRNVWTVAIKEWGWLKESPWPRVKMPAAAFARTRRTDPRELRQLLRGLGYVTGKPPTSMYEQTAWCWLVSQHTALRANEVRTLSCKNVDLRKRVITLFTHKTIEREGVRHVPFTRKAARLLAVLDAQAIAAGRDGYFSISSKSLDALFRKKRDQLMISDLHFHDARADALTRMSKRVDVLTLAKISGHRDLRELLDSYYRETAADIAARI